MPGHRSLEDLDDFFGCTPVVKYTRDAFRLVLRNDLCAFCGGRGGTVDHIEPRGRGGRNRVENLTGACVRCNQAKGAKSLLHFLAGPLHFASPPPVRGGRVVYSASCRNGRVRSHRFKPTPRTVVA